MQKLEGTTIVENIKLDYSEENVLYETLVKYDLDLTLPILLITEHTIAGQTLNQASIIHLRSL